MTNAPAFRSVVLGMLGMLGYLVSFISAAASIEEDAPSCILVGLALLLG